MSDLISRQAALEIIEREQFKGDAISEIEKLPSVEPEKCGDCISRNEAIDVINHVVIKFPGLLTDRQQKTVIETMKLTKNDIENALIKLPSVNPSTDSTTTDSGSTTD